MAAVDAPAVAALMPARSTKARDAVATVAPRASAAVAKNLHLPAAVAFVQKSKGVSEHTKKREYAKWTRSEEDAFFTALKVRRVVVARNDAHLFLAPASRRFAVLPFRGRSRHCGHHAALSGVRSSRSRAHCPQSAHQDEGPGAAHALPSWSVLVRLTRALRPLLARFATTTTVCCAR